MGFIKSIFAGGDPVYHILDLNLTLHNLKPLKDIKGVIVKVDGDELKMSCRQGDEETGALIYDWLSKNVELELVDFSDDYDGEVIVANDEETEYTLDMRRFPLVLHNGKIYKLRSGYDVPALDRSWIKDISKAMISILREYFKSLNLNPTSDDIKVQVGEDYVRIDVICEDEDVVNEIADNFFSFFVEDMYIDEGEINTDDEPEKVRAWKVIDNKYSSLRERGVFDYCDERFGQEFWNTIIYEADDGSIMLSGYLFFE